MLIKVSEWRALSPRNKQLLLKGAADNNGNKEK